MKSKLQSHFLAESGETVDLKTRKNFIEEDKENNLVYSWASFCNLDCLADQVYWEQNSKNPSPLFGDTSITSSSSAPLLRDPSENAYPVPSSKIIGCLSRMLNPSM